MLPRSHQDSAATFDVINMAVYCRSIKDVARHFCTMRASPRCAGSELVHGVKDMRRWDTVLLGEE